MLNPRTVSGSVTATSRSGKNRRGQGFVEYGLIIALVSVASLAALDAVGYDIAYLLSDTSDDLGLAAAGQTELIDGAGKPPGTGDGLPAAP